MVHRHDGFSVLIAALLLLGVHSLARAAATQPYPSKPVRLIVGLAAGGGTDVTARVVASKLGEFWGQPLIVENRPGAGSTLAAEIAGKATPDGYTLLLCQIASHAMAPSLYSKLGYDHIGDFAPISLIGTTPNAFVANPSLPARSLSEFIAYAKANPGKIRYGSSGVGSTLHLSMEWLKAVTRIDVMHVPYKGGAPALAELLGGHLQVMFDNLPSQLAMIQTGRTRPLGVTSAKRAAQLPDVPTIIESGIPGFEVLVWYGVCAPARVPKPILATLNADFVRALNSPDMKQRLADHGVDPVPGTADAFAAFIKSETAKWAKVIKDAGIPPQ
jgi:tripartite-type tricarboxylate transporter receptor subunit TctC